METHFWTKYNSNGDIPYPGASGVFYRGKQYAIGGGSIYSSDLLMRSYDFSTETWSNVTTYNTPISREFSGIAVYEDYLYILPGWSNWVIDSVEDIRRLPLLAHNQTWESLKVGVSDQSANELRNTYAIAVDENLVYLAAGYSADNIFLNSLITLDLSTNPIEVQVLSTDFLSPPLRSAHSMLAAGMNLYIFAGQGIDTK